MKNIQLSDLIPTSVLMNIAKRVRTAAANIAKSKNVPLHSANEIGISTPTITQGRTSVNLTLSPKLMAFEKGSGIHGKSGAKYPITPNTMDALSFAGTNEFAGYQIVTQLVMHPGVKARPFLEPAKRATRAQNLTELRKTNLANTRLIISGMKRVV